MATGTDSARSPRNPCLFGTQWSFGATTHVSLASHLTASPPSAAAAPPEHVKSNRSLLLVEHVPVTVRSDGRN